MFKLIAAVRNSNFPQTPWGGTGGKFEFLTTAIDIHMIRDNSCQISSKSVVRYKGPSLGGGTGSEGNFKFWQQLSIPAGSHLIIINMGGLSGSNRLQYDTAGQPQPGGVRVDTSTTNPLLNHRYFWQGEDHLASTSNHLAQGRKTAYNNIRLCSSRDSTLGTSYRHTAGDVLTNLAVRATFFCYNGHIKVVSHYITTEDFLAR